MHFVFALCAQIAALALPVAAPAPLTQVRDSYPALSPDGKVLLFQSNRSGREALYLADADGGNVRLFLDSGDDPSVAVWSPDGKRIAFVAAVDGQTEIFVMNADGTQRRRLTDHPGDDSHPHWSADGRRLFFNSARATPDLSADWSKQWHNAFSIDVASGGDLRQHTQCKTVCTYAVPSPDGRRIAFRKVTDSAGFDWALRSTARNSEVFVADLDGSHEINLSNHAAYDGWPMWSPDGRWIAFSSNRTGHPGAGQLFLVSPGGGAPLQVTDDSAAYVQHSWSADGRFLYAARSWEAADGSWEYGHLVRIPIDLSAVDSSRPAQ
jgi:TolB protein